jgi:hypothetical protein
MSTQLRLSSVVAGCLALMLMGAFVTTASASCAGAWSSSAVYVGGNVASRTCGGTTSNYTAAYWTQGNDPCTSSGGAGSGAPWGLPSACSGGGGGGTPTPTPVSGGGSIANGLYTVTNQNSGKCVDESGSGTANGTSVQQWTCNGTAAQQWQFTATDSGYFKVATQNNAGQVWDVSGVSTADGGKVQLWSYGGGGNQQWQPIALGNGSYKLVARHDGKCLDVNGASLADGVQLQQWGCNGTGAQSFQISATSSSGGGGGGGGGGGTARSAPYADISLASGENIVSNAQAAGLKGVTLAFLVDGGCTANWGGLGGNVSNANFPNGTSVASAINGLVANGVAVIISWGGANGSVQSSCGTASQVQAMYQSVFNAYPNIAGQDFDIEGGISTTVVAQALAGLKAANPSKSISLTLPVLSSGLVSAGLSIVNACHSAGFHPDTINVMAMDMGSANDNGGNMLVSAEQAAQNTRNQTGDNIGITPMIGVNDTSTEIFTLSDASGLVSWAKGQSYVNRLAFWSLARDNGGCAGQTFASATCSGVSQNNWQFSNILEGF